MYNPTNLAALRPGATIGTLQGEVKKANEKLDKIIELLTQIRDKTK